MQGGFSLVSSGISVRAICAMLFLGCVAPTLAADVSYDDSRGAYLEHPDRPIWMGGDYLRAMLAAYQDFAKILAQQNQDAKRLSKQNGERRAEVAEWLSQLDNYDVRVEETTDQYTVRFSPTLKDPENHNIFGGGASYTISRGSLKILSINRFK